MAMLLYDLHTHTVFSHGKGSPRDNVEAALKAGLKKIGITDHAPGHRAYGVKNTEKYFREIERLKKEYSGRIEILAGMEFNFLGLKGQTDFLDEYREHLDICLAGFHKFALASDFRSLCYLSVSPKRNIVRNTDVYIAVAQSGIFDVITHPGYALKPDIKELARVCAETDTLMEINEKHNDLTPEDFQTAAAEGARFIISSDAHSPEKVGQALGAYRAAKIAGVLEAVVNVEKSGGEGL